MAFEWQQYGPHAFLIRFGGRGASEITDHAELLRLRLALTASLDRDPPDGLIEYVPGFTTGLLRFHPSHAFDLARTAATVLDRLVATEPDRVDQPSLKHIPVIYDGVDLDALARAKGLARADVIRLHSEPVYVVHLLGFSPGFPYLGELNPLLRAPRLAVPRPRVAAGSVAIGGDHTGIYSVDGPGGWHIIGRTSVRLFDIQRSADGDPSDVFFLRPGDRVRFAPVDHFA